MVFFQGKLAVLMVLISLFLAPVQADKLKQTINIDMATNNAAIQSQKKIDKFSNQAQKALAEYRSATRQTETLITYNNYLKTLIKSQTEEKASLEQQLKDIETTQQEIIPLILRMLDSLEKFIQLDIPFLPEERQHRLQRLKAMISRADVTNAEKFRRIIEAYQVENDYGKTIEAYRANLIVGDDTISVDFLRLGRVALYYQRLDGSETGSWNRETKTWDILSPDYRNTIRKGLRIARKEAAPDLLVVPVPAAESVK
jgi:hypothetical protein